MLLRLKQYFVITIIIRIPREPIPNAVLILGLRIGQGKGKGQDEGRRKGTGQDRTFSYE